MVSLQRPFNVETTYEIAVIYSLQDPMCQGRVQISPASLASVNPQNLPWAKTLSVHSQNSSNNGGTVESSHSFKRGDIILVYRPTASEQDWIIAGHPGTITDYSK